jgi:hypothetical protein
MQWFLKPGGLAWQPGDLAWADSIVMHDPANRFFESRIPLVVRRRLYSGKILPTMVDPGCAF